MPSPIVVWKSLNYNLVTREAHKNYLSRKLSLLFRLLAKILNFSSFYLVLDLSSKGLKLYDLKIQDRKEYIENQVEGNIRKLKKIRREKDILNSSYFSDAGSGNLSFLLDILRERFNSTGMPTFGICHGVRTGKENNFLMRYLPRNSIVLGTDISPTVEQFPNCVKWDFQEFNPNWKSKCDFVYSNSLDHAIRPFETLRIWIDSLKQEGSLFLDLGPNSGKIGFTQLDVFAIEPEFFPFVFLRELGEVGCIKSLYFPDSKNHRKVIYEISRNP